MTEPQEGPAAAHPLSLLEPAEVARARVVLAEAGELPEGAAIAHIVLDEPDKAALAAWKQGDPVDRRVRALVVPGPELTMVELVVALREDRRVGQKGIGRKVIGSSSGP